MTELVGYLRPAVNEENYAFEVHHWRAGAISIAQTKFFSCRSGNGCDGLLHDAGVEPVG
jgi:hypothetical protein